MNNIELHPCFATDDIGDSANSESEVHYVSQIEEHRNDLLIDIGNNSILCLECKIEIPEERRVARPKCNYCVTCQNYMDKEYPSGKFRPISLLNIKGDSDEVVVPDEEEEDK